MTKVQIGFWDTESILEFMKITGNCEYDLDLVSGSYAVDAKSLLAVFSLRTAQNIELIIHSNSCDDLLKQLDCYIEHGKITASKKAVS